MEKFRFKERDFISFRLWEEINLKIRTSTENANGLWFFYLALLLISKSSSENVES